MRVESPSARKYYITHSEQENWSIRTLERQIETHTYQRLLSTQTTPVGGFWHCTLSASQLEIRLAAR